MERYCVYCGNAFETPEYGSAWKYRAGTNYCCSDECKKKHIVKMQMSRQTAKMMMNGSQVEDIKAVLALKYGQEQTGALFAKFDENKAKQKIAQREQEVLKRFEAQMDSIRSDGKVSCDTAITGNDGDSGNSPVQPSDSVADQVEQHDKGCVDNTIAKKQDCVDNTGTAPGNNTGTAQETDEVCVTTITALTYKDLNAVMDNSGRFKVIGIAKEEQVDFVSSYDAWRFGQQLEKLAKTALDIFNRRSGQNGQKT